MNEGETSYDVPLNDSSESDEIYLCLVWIEMVYYTNNEFFNFMLMVFCFLQDNLPIAKRRLFESVLKKKGKASETKKYV